MLKAVFTGRQTKIKATNVKKTQHLIGRK